MPMSSDQPFLNDHCGNWLAEDPTSLPVSSLLWLQLKRKNTIWKIQQAGAEHYSYHLFFTVFFVDRKMGGTLGDQQAHQGDSGSLPPTILPFKSSTHVVLRGVGGGEGS